MLEVNKIYQGDCLEVMPKIADKSIDMILCDLPYGTTACKWEKDIFEVETKITQINDEEILLDEFSFIEKMWEQYKRIIKDNGAIVLTASQPFTSKLVMSNFEMFKYEWIWEKNAGSNFALLKYQPMKEHENILIFSKGKTIYNPQMEERAESGKERVKTKVNYKTKTEVMGGKEISQKNNIRPELRYPRSIQKFNRDRGLHPTQKPVALGQYLIRTYTNEGDLVLDNTCGSGSFLVAALLEKRNFIGIEISENYCKIANDRLKQDILF